MGPASSSPSLPREANSFVRRSLLPVRSQWALGSPSAGNEYLVLACFDPNGLVWKQERPNFILCVHSGTELAASAY